LISGQSIHSLPARNLQSPHIDYAPMQGEHVWIVSARLDLLRLGEINRWIGQVSKKRVLSQAQAEFRRKFMGNLLKSNHKIMSWVKWPCKGVTEYHTFPRLQSHGYRFMLFRSRPKMGITLHEILLPVFLISCVSNQFSFGSVCHDSIHVGIWSLHSHLPMTFKLQSFVGTTNTKDHDKTCADQMLLFHSM
jgi:hypothetical protein